MGRSINDTAAFAALLRRTIVLPLILLSLLAAFFTAEVLYLRSLNQWVDHTDRVIAQATALEKQFVDAETGLRGRLLTHRDSFLAPYQTAQTGVTEAIARLRGMLADNLEQTARVAALESGWRDWNQIAARRLRQDRDGDPTDLGAAEDGKARMDRLRSAIGDVLAAETLLRQRRVDDVDASSRLALLLGGALAVALGGLIAFVGRSQLLALSQQYEKVLATQQRQNDLLERQEWIVRGQMLVADAARGGDDRELDATAMAAALLGAIGEHLHAAVGTIYTVAADRDLEWRAGFGGDAPASFDARPRIRRGEGWIGRVAIEGRVTALADVPDDHVRLVTGTGASRPRHLLLAPLSAEGRTNGVIELGFLAAPDARAGDFLAAIGEIAGGAMRSVEYRASLATLLSQTQQQAEALQVNQEELRVANEELEEHARALQRSHAQLETQQEELEATNSELEEQTQILEHERDQLEAARLEVAGKAEQLAQSNQFKSEFLANMSHELRTPLNSSLILAKLLADNKDGNLTPQQVEFARTIHASGSDLLALINDILDLSRIEAGQLEVRPGPVSLPRLLDGLRRTFEPMTAQKGLQLALRLDPAVPDTIETDGQRLQQILTNLLSNAIKFTARGEVALDGTVDDAGHVVFTVRDSGIGIPADKLEVIFEAFRQADGSTHRRFGGTGLGLTISRDLARRLGGDVTVQSIPGRGSTFRVVLPARLDGPPVAVARAPVAPPAPAAPPPPRPSRIADDRDGMAPDARAILVVEDDERFAQILLDLAREQGFRGLIATTAGEGVELAQRHRPKAIVLDMHLPDASGLTVLERLKRDGETRHIPVHVVSVEDYSRRALELGAVGYDIKPIDRDALGTAFERLREKFEQTVGRVLIIEDVPAQRESLRHLLESEHVEIVAVGDAESGLEQLRRRTFDCLVLDLGLPDMSGYELLERIAADETVSFPPVIVYTGRELTPNEELRLRRHSSSVVIKGARSPERLLDEVTLFLHRVESSLPREQQRLLRVARNRETAFEGRRILLVEDDVRNIFALTSVLEPKGATLAIARNGHEALAALEQARRDGGRVDIVLMDVMMPEMDGLTAMREIRRRPEWAKLPIVALTAKAMPEDRQQCLDAGANDYIAKPLDVEKLLSLMRVWMRSAAEVA